VPDRRDEVAAFGVQPRRRRGRIGDAGRHGRLDLGHRQPQHVRVQQPGGAVDRVQVPVVQPVQGRVPVLLLVFRPFGRVPAEQVVEAVAAGRVVLDEVRAGEPVEQLAGPPRVRAGERGDGIGADVHAGHQAQQAEHPPRRVRQCGVREVESPSYCGLLVTLHRERGQQVALTQLQDVVGDPAPRVVRQVGRRDAQREREVDAQLGELAGRFVFGVDALVAQHPGEQVQRVVRAEHVERELAGAVHGDQSAHPVAAGHHDHAAGAGRQQRPHLVRAGDVVQ
jgi:hypothetical protein